MGTVLQTTLLIQETSRKRGEGRGYLGTELAGDRGWGQLHHVVPRGVFAGVAGNVGGLPGLQAGSQQSDLLRGQDPSPHQYPGRNLQSLPRAPPSETEHWLGSSAIPHSSQLCRMAPDHAVQLPYCAVQLPTVPSSC